MTSVRESIVSAECHYAPVYNSLYEKVTLKPRTVPASDYVTNLSSIIAGTPVSLDDDLNNSKKRAPTPPPKPTRSNKSTPTKDQPRDAANNNYDE